ncbi:uncharacterized protein LOC129567174 [Sitodiplosis mosellana]|uniref:uncharacterized protein LOC129567174 n=1 Tax=Sitodiplosis mosellana TaxID=263140 RepID=UPI002443BC40|nr:uncharacterized protein LOC129567174 [Sitodiplosis mosellana]
MMTRRHLAFVASVFQHSEEPTNYNIQYFLDEVTSSKYNVIYVKIDSLRKKLDDLELYVHRLHQRGTEIHVIAITEINIHAETSKYVNLPDYNAYFSTNPNGNGGVAIFIHKSLTSGLIDNLENGGINCLIANIPKLNVNVGVLYKSPTATTESLLEYYKRILKKNQRMILFSDVDIDLLISNVSTRRYTNTVREHNFFILNKIEYDSATREISLRNGLAEYSIMDHVLSNGKQFKYSFSLCDTTFSDDKIIALGFHDNKPDKIEFIAEANAITYNMVDYRMFNQRFSEIDLQSVGSIDSLVSEMIVCKMDSTIQRQRFRRNRDKPWIYDESLDKSDRFKMRSEAYANEINQLDIDSKRLCDTINECLTNNPSNKHSIDAMYNKTRQIVADKKEIANILNGYFLDIGKILYNRIPHMMNCVLPGVDVNRNHIQYISTTTAEVKKKIDLMKNNNNFHDSISSNTLKFHSRKLAPHLKRLFNDCFRNGVYPRSLKIDRIVPVYKKFDPLQPKNYRPISVPPSLSKLMESIICDRITDFCLQNNIIDRNQYGFQKNSSAISAVVTVVDYLQVGLNEYPGSIGACLFIDLKKASNTIPHKLFMNKLFRIGIQGPLYNLIADYLHERRQYVDIDNVLSEEAVNPNAFSIPQGSALGPLFFLLYINDIFKMKLHGKIILFGDDTAIVYVETDPVILKRHMESDLKLLNKWFNKNALTLNTEKTKAMLFNAENIELQINLNVGSKAIEFVDNHKYMGVYLQNNLKWDVHINKIITEISALADAFKKIGNKVNGNISLGIYYKYVYNHLSKIASIYGTFATKVQLKRLQVAQDMAIKSIFSGANDYNINAIYVQYKLLKVSQIIKYDLALLIYKVKNNFLKLNRQVKDISGKNILSCGLKYFNSLDSSIQNQHELHHFKRNFKRICINSNRY